MIRRALAALLLLPVAGHADVVERIVWGEVVNVEPVVEQRNVAPSPDCPVSRPETFDLAELLAWDLRRECLRHSTSRIRGYRVDYRWDGRTYSRLMDESPGKRIPLLVKFK